VKPELDFFVLGQASKFLQAGAVRIASDEPAETTLKDVAFRNPNGTVVLYALNAGKAAQGFRIGFRGKTAATTLPAGGSHVCVEAVNPCGGADACFLLAGGSCDRSPRTGLI